MEGPVLCTADEVFALESSKTVGLLPFTSLLNKPIAAC
jgi:hypothetical protein